MSHFPIGATVLYNGRYKAKVVGVFPEGSHEYAFPHYRLKERGNPQIITVAMGRVGVVETKDKSRKHRSEPAARARRRNEYVDHRGKVRRSGKVLPSVKTIVRELGPSIEHNGGDPKKVATAMRKLMRTKRSDEAMQAMDKLLGTHGVEHSAQRRGDDGGESFDYLNTGDSYAATVVLYKGRFLITGWSDMLEKLEKRGHKFEAKGTALRPSRVRFGMKRR